MNEVYQIMRRGFGGFCRGVAGGRGERTCSLMSAESRFGRWQRTHKSIFRICCGAFIFIFFAIVTTISYRYEPSSLTLEGGRLPPARWNPNAVMPGQNRRILTGARLGSLERQIKLIEGHRRREVESEIMESEIVGSENGAEFSDDDHMQTPALGLVTELKIFVYDLPSSYNTDWLNDSRCSSHLFAAEVALHQILLESPIRTLDPEQADFFFVPVYVSCNFSPKNGFPTLVNASTILQSAVDLISEEFAHWNRSSGSDHIFVVTHDYGACFQSLESVAKSRGVPEFLQNSILLQTFGQKEGNHPCQNPEKSIVIPPYISPDSVRQHWQPVEEPKRTTLAHFRGKLEVRPKNVSGQFYSKAIRTTIWQKFRKNRPGFFVARKRLEGYQSELLGSKFCLAPLGWAPWSPRIVESVLYGCVPVIIADGIALPHSHVIDWPSISITVSESDVENLDQILHHVSETSLSKIQENLWKEENRKALLYNQPLEIGDASWQIFNLLAERKLGREAEEAVSLTMPGELAVGGEFEDDQLRGEESFEFSSNV